MPLHSPLTCPVAHCCCSLDMKPIKVASLLCKVAHTGDLEFLRRLLLAGADADAPDYDKRCALHISASQGNLPAVKLLVVEGDATVDIADRWGNTPLDNARRVAATGVVAYLEEFMEKMQVRICVGHVMSGR